MIETFVCFFYSLFILFLYYVYFKEQYDFLYACLVEFVGSFGLLSCQSSSFDRFSTSSSSNRASSLGRNSLNHHHQNQSNDNIELEL
jgi:hypothetical protein